MNPGSIASYIKDQTGRSYRISRMISSPLYSAALFPATVPVGTERTFFTAGVGATGQGFAAALTERETNLDTSGKLPDEQVFLVNKIGVKIDQTPWLKDTDGDLLVLPTLMADFLSHAVLSYEQPGYKHTYGCVWEFPAGGGQAGYSVVTNNSVVNNGAPTVDSMYHLQLPILILGGASFKFLINMLGADGFAAMANVTAFTVWIQLHGILATAVVPG